MSLAAINLLARDPVSTGAFWAGALDLDVHRRGHDGLFGADLRIGELTIGFFIERTDHAPPPGWRLHLDLLGGAGQADVVDRLIGLGATPLDVGQRDVPWVVLADSDGNPFCVMEERSAYRDTGPIAALPLDSADPERDGALYAAITGWTPVDGVGPVSLRHPSRVGPLLELCPEPLPKIRANRTHLDVRSEPGGPEQDELVELACSLGATRADDDWAVGLPWVVMRDTSGNEFCILADDPRSP